MVVLHSLIRLELEEPELLIEEGDMNDIPDFAGMLREGMTRAEREEQLLFETDEEGNIKLDEHTGKKIPRGSFALRAYAVDPDGPVKGDPGILMFWKTPQIVEAILKKEGFTKKGGKAKTKAASPPKKEEEEEMAEAQARKKVVLRRNANTAGGKGEKEDKTPAKVKAKANGANGKVAKPATAKKRAAAEEPEEKTSKGGDKALTRLEAKVDELQKTIVMAVTLLHDVMQQKFSETQVGIDKALNSIDGVSSEIFQGPTEGKGKNKEPKLDYQCLLGQEMSILSYLESAQETSSDEEEPEEDEDDDSGEDEEDEEEEEEEEEEEDE
jgi:hypothetical protein